MYQTYSTINTFILAMVLHPHVLKKAQEEIDRVIGPKRLPEFDDRENLPYIEAIFQEVLRSVVISYSSAKLQLMAAIWATLSAQMAPRSPSR